MFKESDAVLVESYPAGNRFKSGQYRSTSTSDAESQSALIPLMRPPLTLTEGPAEWNAIVSERSLMSPTRLRRDIGSCQSLGRCPRRSAAVAERGSNVPVSPRKTYNTKLKLKYWN